MGDILTTPVPAQAQEMEVISIDTNSSWKSFDAEIEGWTSLAFDDSYWSPSEELFPIEDFGNASMIWYPKEEGLPSPKIVWFRKIIEIDSDEILLGRVYFKTGYYGYNEKVELFVNNNYTGEIYSLYSHTKELDITSYLHSGKNILAIKANLPGGPAENDWWGLTGIVKYRAKTSVPEPEVPSEPNSEPEEPTPSTTFALTVNVSPDGGAVNLSPSQPPEGYVAGTEVTLTASAAEGYEFDRWSGDTSATSPVVTVTMTSDKSVTANFKEETAIEPPPPPETSSPYLVYIMGGVLGVAVLMGILIRYFPRQHSKALSRSIGAQKELEERIEEEKSKIIKAIDEELGE